MLDLTLQIESQSSVNEDDGEVEPEEEYEDGCWCC